MVVASFNPKKLKELAELLADLSVKLYSLADFPKVHEVEEDGMTFRDNAVKKALGYARQTGKLTLAEDSGLVIDYLKGAPGVYSARFAGNQKNDLANCEKVLKLMEGVPRSKRTASFVCAVALAISGKALTFIEERVAGTVELSMRGSGGFGYDPLFFYPEFGKTFAEVSPGEKHSVSHRGKALRKIKEFLQGYWAVSSSG